MKLYLSSVGIPESDLLTSLITTSNLSVSIIPNAWDVYPDERRLKEIQNITTRFTELGFEVSIIDLNKVTDETLMNELKGRSLVWVMGGNSFYLNEKVHKTGMSTFIKQLLENGLVYGGESAGAVLACSTLHGVELLDDPQKASEVIWDGLKLVDFGIVPHWGYEKYAELLKACKTEMEKHVEVKAISNNQAVIVTDEDITIVGK